MSKFNKGLNLILLIIPFLSCKSQIKSNDNCLKMFNYAKKIAYANPTQHSTLDSALVFVNSSIKCDSIKKAAIDFKIILLINLNKFNDAKSFVDSLKEGDFTFRYKKKFISGEIQSLIFNSTNDTASRNAVYREIVSELEDYISANSILDKIEFVEIYTDLFSVKEKFQDSVQIKKYAELLLIKYPEQKLLFDFLMKE